MSEKKKKGNWTTPEIEIVVSAISSRDLQKGGSPASVVWLGNASLARYLCVHACPPLHRVLSLLHNLQIIGTGLKSPVDHRSDSSEDLRCKPSMKANFALRSIVSAGLRTSII